MGVFGGKEENRTMRVVAGLLISTFALFCGFTHASADLRQTAVSEPENSPGVSHPEKLPHLAALSNQRHSGLEVTPPPARWDHKFVGDLIEKDLPAKEAEDLCLKLGNRKAEACAGVGTYTSGEKIGQRICIIVIATDDRHGTLEQYRRHEIAHCNGWNQSHSN
jgi:hypothetical protein